MERVIERCSGLDVHKKTVAACVRVPEPNGARTQHVRTFGTTAGELLALRDWLEAHKVTHWPWRARACTGRSHEPSAQRAE
jgi:transposase